MGVPKQLDAALHTSLSPFAVSTTRISASRLGVYAAVSQHSRYRPLNGARSLGWLRTCWACI
ncbi:hypothetical protein PLICRDRAFT_46392 [Plicaturopsis crispa FD-325 SS-3]|uniref:Uncharacterized protein n=1 Tax=Plicaturopsis crispa FD-325 SS-3 TaxID=944288 RepID=A0A0C9SQT6_PLICR|nr:hypothetical protein PLICRDRAFT_46392 [Plicaturopsis crispa FD-325 SS-3]